MGIVNRPLASVIARADRGIARPRDLEGRTVGVTGLPSDDAVLDSELEADGGDPSLVDRVTIGFNAVASLASGRIDAATGFWNAEAVVLRRLGIPVRVFRVDSYGAPRYPELVLCTARRTLSEDASLVRAVVRGTAEGYRFASAHQGGALDDLQRGAPDLDAAEQRDQMRALGDAIAPAPLDRDLLRRWVEWDRGHGILREPIDVGAAFHLRANSLLR
jgi:putative hydroxymethylpyrimidine transport system substrate-binding protein